MIQPIRTAKPAYGMHTVMLSGGMRLEEGGGSRGTRRSGEAIARLGQLG